jgi:hypothetical protein
VGRRKGRTQKITERQICIARCKNDSAIVNPEIYQRGKYIEASVNMSVEEQSGSWWSFGGW